MNSPFNQQLDRNGANFAALTPLSHIERSASIYPDRLAIVHGDLRQTWAQPTRALPSARPAPCKQHGIGKGDTVAVMLPNTPPMVEAHFGIPMSGRRAQHAQHPPRRRSAGLHARPRRGQGRDRGPPICAV